MKKLILCISAILSLTSCTNESAKQFAPAQGRVDTAVNDDTGIEIYDPSVDILFVVDNSFSMAGHQNLLAKNIPLFTQEFTKKTALDYHVGVVTTDMEAHSDSGHLQGSVLFVSKQTPNADFVLARNILVGTDGSGTEESFTPVIAAITPPLVDTSNKDFYRPHAKLAIVFITDTADHSYLRPKEFLENLLKLKGNDANQILAYGVLAASFDPDCQEDPPRPENIEEFLKMVNKGTPNEMSLCSQTYGAELAALGQDIARKVSSYIYLNRLPDPKSLKVTVGTVELPLDPSLGWSYDPSLNAVVLGDKINWQSYPVGAKVKVHFNAAKPDTRSH